MTTGLQESPGGDVWTMEEVRAFFKVSRTTIYEWMERDGLPHVRIGGSLRFDKGDVLAWWRAKAKSA